MLFSPAPEWILVCDDPLKPIVYISPKEEFRYPHRRKDMMPTLFAGLCQMSKMSRVQRVLESVRVRFGICWLLVRCRGNVSPPPSPEWVGSEVWKLMASCQMSRTCLSRRLPQSGSVVRFGMCWFASDMLRYSLLFAGLVSRPGTPSQITPRSIPQPRRKEDQGI